MAQGTEQLLRKGETHPLSSFKPYRGERFVHNTQVADALSQKSMSTTTLPAPVHPIPPFSLKGQDLRRGRHTRAEKHVSKLATTDLIFNGRYVQYLRKQTAGE